MINQLSKKVTTILILLLLGLQATIYLYNQKPLYVSFSKKNITVENFSSIVLSNSGITKIGSEKLNKIDDQNIDLIGESYLENDEYKIYGENISINLKDEMSYSNEAVKIINNMGTLKANSFKNLDYEGKIFFSGAIEFIINKKIYIFTFFIIF